MTPIETLASAADGEYRIDMTCGVYVLILSDVPVYIGSSRNIPGRVRTHAGSGIEFDRAIWFSMPWKRALRVEGALIRALNPRLNTSAPAYHGGDNAILASLGLQVNADEAENARPWQESRSATQRAGYYKMSKRDRKRISSIAALTRKSRRSKPMTRKAPHPPLDSSPPSTPQDISTHCSDEPSEGATLTEVPS